MYNYKESVRLLNVWRALMNAKGRCVSRIKEPVVTLYKLVMQPVCLHILCSQSNTLLSLFHSERHYSVFAEAAPPLDVCSGTSFRFSVIIHTV